MSKMTKEETPVRPEKELKPCDKYPCEKLCWVEPSELSKRGIYCPFEQLLEKEATSQCRTT